MMAALTAADRGHTVTLYEKSGKLGGALNFADYVSFKYPLKAYKDYLAAQVNKHANVTVKLNTAAGPDEVKGYDAVIAAVGATPLVPPIPGVEAAIPALDSYGKEDCLGKSVIVIGGGQVGLETALHLTKLGRQVTIVEMQADIAPDASKTHRDELLVEIRNDEKLRVLTGARCTGVTANSVTYEKDGKAETIQADNVILAAGMKALVAEADALMGLTPDFAEIGDCVRARTAEWATKEGFYAAMRL